MAEQEFGEKEDKTDCIQIFLAHAVQGNGGSVHVWGAIWTTGRSELQVLRRTVTGATYIETLQRFLQTPNLPPDWRL